MSNSWLSCQGCGGSDPTKDTVKVNPNLIQGHGGNGLNLNGGKENVKPLQFPKKNEAEEQKLAEERQREARRRKEEEAVAALRAEEEEERLHLEAQKAQEDNARKAQEERARHEAEEIMRREVEEMARMQEIAAVEEAYRQEQAQKAAEEQARVARQLEAEELEEAQALVGVWCTANGFEGVSSQKKTFRGAKKFALHTAAKHKNEEMVALLVKCGADRHALDSKGQTPKQVAEKMNKDGSHEDVISLLSRGGA